MILLKPVLYHVLQAKSESNHLVSFLVGNKPGALVPAYIALLAKLVQLANQSRIGADGEGQALDGAIMGASPALRGSRWRTGPQSPLGGPRCTRCSIASLR
ncbi:MAG: hypothetical protein ABIK79_15675 [Chloroflexota bacterium]|nr:hypothetical protein [Anaerolineae bacterium]